MLKAEIQRKHAVVGVINTFKKRETTETAERNGYNDDDDTMEMKVHLQPVRHIIM